MMKTAIVSAAAAFTLTACISVLPEAKIADGLHRIGPLEASETLSKSVVIREPEGGRVFGGRAMASEGTDGSLRLIPGAEWTESATRMLQVGVLDALAGDGPGYAMPAGSTAPGEYELAWRMSDFSVAGTTARCRLDLTLLNGKTREPAARDTVMVTADATGDSTSERARALTEAARKCALETAAFVAEQAK